MLSLEFTLLAVLDSAYAYAVTWNPVYSNGVRTVTYRCITKPAIGSIINKSNRYHPKGWMIIPSNRPINRSRNKVFNYILGAIEGSHKY